MVVLVLRVHLLASRGNLINKALPRRHHFYRAFKEHIMNPDYFPYLPPLDLRTTDEIEYAADTIIVGAREIITGLPERPGTLR